MKAALDTNILAYAEGVNGAERKKAALDLIDAFPHDSVVIPVQALGELFQVLVRKAGRKPADARAAVLDWRDAFALVETSAAVMLTALDLTARQFGIWDAVILSAAAEAECRLLLSEDMQPGFSWRGVTVVNPFAHPAHPLLTSLLRR
ncbi:MAG TPA: PIN domain-containing protein [Acidobacteriaceae bacterium]|nr:PIN domain-containing protein [Acidobacteriaceae bacterium]